MSDPFKFFDIHLPLIQVSLYKHIETHPMLELVYPFWQTHWYPFQLEKGWHLEQRLFIKYVFDYVQRQVWLYMLNIDPFGHEGIATQLVDEL